MRQPEIHVFKYVRGGWIWALIDNHGSYHYFENRQFPTAAEAKQFALDHIGTPHYGGSYQTVHGWRTPKVKIHKRGPEFAGMLAANPGGRARAGNPYMVQIQTKQTHVPVGHGGDYKTRPAALRAARRMTAEARGTVKGENFRFSVQRLPPFQGKSDRRLGNPIQKVFHSRQAALDYALAHGATQFSIRKLRS